ncbi:MAG: (2Fe-2S)-binding protein [Chloroflexi bacterium]|nr:(2Fe-2S)-binding protein [Chloroflexota bacterium]
MEQVLIKLTVNGREEDVRVSPHKTLLEVLRDDLSLTGAKNGCEDGSCGTCTVLLDGAAVRSCLLLAMEAQGHEIVTIEGLSDGQNMSPLQEIFVNQGAVQCGFCSPGMILTAKALLDSASSPTETEIREAISGNLCRCTGYTKIVEAVMAASGQPVPVRTHPYEGDVSERAAS